MVSKSSLTRSDSPGKAKTGPAIKSRQETKNRDILQLSSALQNSSRRTFDKKETRFTFIGSITSSQGKKTPACVLLPRGLTIIRCASQVFQLTIRGLTDGLLLTYMYSSDTCLTLDDFKRPSVEDLQLKTPKIIRESLNARKPCSSGGRTFQR